MTRNGGCFIDAAAARIRDRNGIWCPVAAIATSEHGVYYARPIEGNNIFWYQERWVLPQHGLVFNRFAYHDHRTDAVDWYIETDMTDVAGSTWTVRDGYLDVYVQDGLRYDLEDTRELADALAAGEISLDDAIAALHALDLVCESLRRNGYSGRALLRALAPSLPAPSITRNQAGKFVHGTLP